MSKLLLGFHHGIGDFIAFTPTLRALKSRYDEIHLCCKLDLFDSGVLAHCPYLTKTVPILGHPWGPARNQVLHDNTNSYLALLREGEYTAQFYLPDNWQGKKPEVYADFCCLPGNGFDRSDPGNWRFEVWPDLQMHQHIIEECERLRPYLFLHHITPTWPQKSFTIEHIPEVTSFQGAVVNTDTQKFPSINIAFIYLWKADAVVLADSVFMWAAWALNKPIDYLQYNADDPRVHPLDVHRHLVRRCNIEFLPDAVEKSRPASIAAQTVVTAP